MEDVTTACAWQQLIAGRQYTVYLLLNSEVSPHAHAGSALTTFNKGGCNLNPKVIAHRSSATRGEMLVNSKAFRQFSHKAKINDNVSLAPCLICMLA